MAGEASRKNGRKGGRPTGSKSAATLEREAVQRAFDRRVMEHADRLFHAQLAASEGFPVLFHRPQKGGKLERVTNVETVRRFFDDELTEEDGYFFVYTEPPDASAADRLLNRALGKPVERHEVSGPGGGAIKTIVNNYATPAPVADRAPAR